MPWQTWRAIIMAIPAFCDDGYLPEGLHRATEAEVTFRFGSHGRRRKRLALQLRRWGELARVIGGRRLLADGSFVTAKEEPNDVDAVLLLPTDFQQQIDSGIEAAVEMEQ